MAAVAASSGGVGSIIPAFAIAVDQARGEGMMLAPANKSTRKEILARLSGKRTTQRPTKVIYDASLNAQHIFHWYYLYINAIGLLGSIATPFIELYSEYLYVYLFATAAILIGTGILVLGQPLLTMVEPQQGLVQACLTAVKLSWAERKTARARPPATGPRPATRPALYGPSGGGSVQRGVPDKTVEDLKQALHTLRILPALTMFWLAFNQCSRNLLSQAAQMRRPVWLSNDLMGNTNPIALTLFVPAFDGYIFPWLRRKGWEPTPMKRMTFGFLLVSLGMV